MSPQTATEIFETMLSRLDGILTGHGKPVMVRPRLKYVLMDNLEVKIARPAGDSNAAGSTLVAYVHLDDLMTEAMFVERLPRILEGGPSWIHANWQRTHTHGDIVDINVGAKVGNPLPIINVSFQPNPMELVVS